MLELLSLYCTVGLDLSCKKHNLDSSLDKLLTELTHLPGVLAFLGLLEVVLDEIVGLSASVGSQFEEDGEEVDFDEDYDWVLASFKKNDGGFEGAAFDEGFLVLAPEDFDECGKSGVSPIANYLFFYMFFSEMAVTMVSSPLRRFLLSCRASKNY